MREHLCPSENPSTEEHTINECYKNSFSLLCELRLQIQDSFLMLQNLKPRKSAKLGVSTEWKTRMKSSFKGSFGLTRKMDPQYILFPLQCVPKQNNQHTKKTPFNI